MLWTTPDPPTMLIRSFPNMNSVMMNRSGMMNRSFPNMNSLMMTMIRSFPNTNDVLCFPVEMYRRTSHTEAPHKVKAHSP